MLKWNTVYGKGSLSIDDTEKVSAKESQQKQNIYSTWTNLSQSFKHGGWSKAPQESRICLFLKIELGNSGWGGEQNTTMGQGPAGLDRNA